MIFRPHVNPAREVAPKKACVYSWLRQNTQDEEGKRFRSTRAIASWNNLTEERVQYICSLHKEIYLSTRPQEDRLGVYGIAGREH